MNFLEIGEYNPDITLLGGQAFNWYKIGNSFYGFFQDRILKIKFKDNKLIWKDFPERDDEKFVIQYFNLNEDYESKINTIKSKDKFLLESVVEQKGLRLLKQPFEQTLLSFILSSNKNIKAIRKTIYDLSNVYGEPVLTDVGILNTFPKIENLLRLEENNYRELSFGYRSKYFFNAVQKLNNSKFDNLQVNDEKTREFLKSFNGVGDKISDCVMAFSLSFNNITPIDLWTRKILCKLYNINDKINYNDLKNWYQDYFGDLSSLSGQFLFENYRNKI